ncbi:MAG: hypothetical protein AAFR98_01110 [Pseudomonadota bacterium]
MIKTLAIKRGMGGMIIAMAMTSCSLAYAQTFEGAGFSIEVPEGFDVEPSLQSNSTPGEFDSVRFHSPDNQVVFYVFAPKHGGMPADIMMRPGEEQVVAERGDTKGDYVHSWWTVKDNRENYMRSYHSRSNLNGSDVVVFGIRYTDSDALSTYSDAYKAFKASFQKRTGS